MFGNWDANNSVPRTWWWGERGLVGALFHDLSVFSSAERWNDFFCRISFSGEPRQFGRISYAHVVVEPSFGSQGFGRPDAVALVQFETPERFAIFFEAKLGTYEEAAKAPFGRSTKGFNSSVNGQLELNHRLSMALHAWSRPAHLEEEEWILNTPYVAAKIRRVKKREVLDTLLSPIKQLPPSNYLHVILTADVINPFNDPKIAAYMPSVFLPNSEDDQWSTEKKRFGWVGLSKISEMAQSWRTRGETSLFLDMRRFLHADFAVSDDPAVPAQLTSSAPGWTANRPPRGVSLIFAPRIARHTYLHFSWRQNNCALRDYSESGVNPPEARRNLTTSEVLVLIEDEFPTTIQRPQCTDTAAWHQRVIEANRNRGL